MELKTVSKWDMIENKDRQRDCKTERIRRNKGGREGRGTGRGRRRERGRRGRGRGRERRRGRKRERQRDRERMPVRKDLCKGACAT